MYPKHLSKLFIVSVVLAILHSCQNEAKKTTVLEPLGYDSLVAVIKSDSTIDKSDTANLLDKDFFDPAADSSLPYFDSLAHIYERDSLMIRKVGINDSGLLDRMPANEAVTNSHDTFTNAIKKINADELKALKYNLVQLHAKDSILNSLKGGSCKQISCRVWARVNKTKQQLYLYIDGKMVDSFLVSTGDKKHETPLFDMRPTGPTFQKYTSKKYPGGNYNGLGNMPYVVFIKGGYGIHGTTKGNIPKLGKKASHGCIRVHPDNGKIFFELVRKAGLNNTWVTVEN